VVVAVLVTSAKRRRWAPLIRAAGAAIPVLALAPLWSYQASGRAFPTPYSEYSRVYVPWNMPGFTIDRTPPIRAEIPAITKFRTEWLPIHEGHLPRRLPRIAWERFVGIGVTFFGDGGLSARSIPPLRYLLLVGFLVGLFSLPRSVGLAAVGAPVLFLTMLWLASRPLWTVYYLEVFPVVALATGLGCWRLARWSCERWNKPRLEPRLLVTIGLVVAAPGTVDRLIRAKQQQEDVRFVSTELHRAVATIPGRVVVFIEPGPAHRPYESYAENWPDPAAARVWLVHDRGADNARLLSLAPDRTPYLFDPGSGRLRPLGER
jgi:hypothetical protein